MTTTQDDQQQNQQRSTARRDQLTSYQTIAQKSWHDSKVFEVHSDETKPIKFFGNFPYPYMNGLLHLGHAFSLSKLVRFFFIISIRGFIVFCSFVCLSSSLACVCSFLGVVEVYELSDSAFSMRTRVLFARSLLLTCISFSLSLSLSLSLP